MSADAQIYTLHHFILCSAVATHIIPVHHIDMTILTSRNHPVGVWQQHHLGYAEVEVTGFQLSDIRRCKEGTQGKTTAGRNQFQCTFRAGNGISRIATDTYRTITNGSIYIA